MKIVNRYILSEVVQYFIISLFAFVGMLLTIRMIKLASLVINRGVSVDQIAIIFVAVIPTFLEIALPLAALLGTMLAFARLSGDSEIIILRGSGISLRQVIWPIALFGILTTAIGQGTSIYLRPWGFKTLHQGLYQIAKSKSTAGLEQAVFNKLGKMTLYAQVIDHETGELARVVVDDRRTEESRSIIIAQRGMVTSQDQNQTLALHLRDGSIHEKIEGKYVLTKFVENNILLDSDALYGEDEEKKGRRITELSNADLDRLTADLKSLPAVDIDNPESLKKWRDQAGRFLPEEEIRSLLPSETTLRITRNKIEHGRRFSLPFASFILALLGMALGIQPARAQRAWGATLSIAIGMLVFVVYYVLFSIGIALAEAHRIAPVIALWGPNFLISGVTFYLLRKIYLEKWISIGSGLETFLTSLSGLFRRRRRLSP